MTSSFRYSINIHHSNIPAAQADGVNIYNSYAILGFCSQWFMNRAQLIPQKPHKQSYVAPPSLK